MTLHDYLKARQISKYRAAKDLGVAWTTIQRWIKGDTTPLPAQMRAVQTYTGGDVTPNDWVKP